MITYARTSASENKASHNLCPEVSIHLFLSSAAFSVSVCTPMDVGVGHRSTYRWSITLKHDAGSSLFFYCAHARWCNTTGILTNPPHLEYHCFHQPEPVSTSMALIKVLRLWDSLYSLARAGLRTKIWVLKAQIAVDTVVCELLPHECGFLIRTTGCPLSKA